MRFRICVLCSQGIGVPSASFRLRISLQTSIATRWCFLNTLCVVLFVASPFLWMWAYIAGCRRVPVLRPCFHATEFFCRISGTRTAARMHRLWVAGEVDIGCLNEGLRNLIKLILALLQEATCGDYLKSRRDFTYIQHLASVFLSAILYCSFIQSQSVHMYWWGAKPT